MLNGECPLKFAPIISVKEYAKITIKSKLEQRKQFKKFGAKLGMLPDN